MISLFITFLIIFIIAIISSVIFLAIWTYRDAKNRGLNPWGWMAIVMLVPNFIGLLLYFFIGRRESIGNCVKCNAKIPMNSNFCLNCATEVSLVKKGDKATKKFMVGFISSIVVMIIAFVAFTTTLFIQDGFKNKCGVSIASMESNIGDNWRVSYFLSTKDFTNSIKINEDGPEKIYLQCESNEGKVYLTLVQNGIQEVKEITNVPEGTEIDLSKFEKGIVKLYLSNDDARKVKFKAEWK